MKKIAVALFLTVLVGMMAQSFSRTQTPLQEISAQYQDQIKLFSTAVSHFKKAAEAFAQGEINQKALIESFRTMRQRFKSVEFMLDYLQPQDVKDHLNGAPLPKTERNAPRLIVLEPKGMQAIEELVYADLVPPKELQKLSKELELQTQQIAKFAAVNRFTDRQVLEALRMSLVRMMSMGITGFDTPASDQALAETEIAWKASADAIRQYLTYSRSEQLNFLIEQKLSLGEQQFLEQRDFDTFDRLSFIRDCVEPLYGALLELHQHLGYELPQEVFLGELPYNYQSKHIFSVEFFNLNYYTGLGAVSDRPAARKLGKLLFFDPILSGNLERSCASCHKPELAFSDGQAKSIATDFKGDVGRNAPGLINALISERFFYDLRADRMEAQMEHVIFSPKEFATNYQTIFTRLNQSEEYQALFQAAFPEQNGAISRYTLSAAIVAYLSELSSFNSQVDQYLRGEIAILEPKVKEGFNLFMGKAACGTCHFAPTFSGLVPPFFEENESEVLGVLSAPGKPELDSDRGRVAGGVVHFEAPFFEKSFKTTTVRNVAHTAPYFHNGAYQSLTDVVEFYNHGGALGLGLNLENQTLPGDSLHLSQYEKEALIAFMEALSDTSCFSPPPAKLPVFSNQAWNKRSVGGSY